MTDYDVINNFATEANDYKIYSKDFCLRPQSWDTFKSTKKLNWKRVRFTPENKSNVPDNPGLYAFIIVIENLHTDFPTNGYVMYIGKAGDKSKNTLRKRYASYLSEQQIKRKRPNLTYMLQNWKDGLYFSYITLSNKLADIGALETKLLDAIVPPYSSQGYSAKVRPAAKAF